MARPSIWTMVGVLMLVTLVTINFSIIFIFNITQTYMNELRTITGGKEHIKDTMLKYLTTEHVNELRGFLSFAAKQIERVHVVDPNGLPQALQLDVSSDGEYSYIAQHMFRQRKNINRYVVDIGAYDGILGSNSYNFFQNGWSGVVVEPHPGHFNSLRKNLERFVHRGQRIGFARVAVSDFDGDGTLHQFGDVQGMENSLKNISMDKLNALQGMELKVRVISVKSLCREFSIPKEFGVLSIDAEGVGDTILAAFIELGYRPRYVIYEWLGVSPDSTAPLVGAGYVQIATIGFNQIWCHKSGLDLS